MTCPPSTFSICAYDPQAQEWGVAVESRAFVVGALVPWAKAGVGAVATQAWTNTSYGPRGLALLARGLTPDQVIEKLTARDPGRARRQLGIVDAQGRAANYTGEQCMDWAGGLTGPNYSIQGNILAGEKVVKAMARAFTKTKGPLAARLLAALEAAQAAGGDKRGQQSAALIVVRARSDESGAGDRYVDLRVDDHKRPIAELRRLYQVWEREMYPYLEQAHIKRLLKLKQYARAQHAHREFMAQTERVARRNPENAEMFNALAWGLAENGLGLDAALRYARRAAQLAPKDANILDTLAEVHYRRGEFKRAVEIEQDLVKRNPANRFYADQLTKFERAARRAAKQSAGRGNL